MQLPSWSSPDRRYALIIGVCLVGYFALALSFLALLPRSDFDRARMALSTMVAGIAITAVVLRPGPRRAVFGAGFLYWSAILEALVEPAGFALALFLPLLGGVLLVSSFHGRQLALGLLVGWVVTVTRSRWAS
jgi:hypothetical protein